MKIINPDNLSINNIIDNNTNNKILVISKKKNEK